MSVVSTLRHLLVLSALWLTCAAPSLSAAPLKVGDPAPDFELDGSDGTRHRLSDYRGRMVVLAWFPKAFTGG